MNLFDMPKLGFGFMRLPMNNEVIDISATNDMVDEYMRSGLNYFDTAYVYHGGESEKALKASLVERYPRDSFFIADKLPGWELKSPEDVDKIFTEQLDRAGVEYFDFYLLHSITNAHLKTYDKYNCWQWGKKMKEIGKIRHFGFSFHDNSELLDKVLTDHPEVEFVQLQINYADWNNSIVHSGQCYEVARKHNVPIIIMEPVKGGMLASLKPELEEKLKSVSPEMSVASWAMRFCLSLDGIMTILSGMSNSEQMADNLNVVKNFKPFTSEEKEMLDQVVEEMLSTPTVGCTNCRYCVEDCPSKLNIPEMIHAYNTLLTYGDHVRPHFHYEGITSDGNKANTCIKCGQCENLCPQHIEIVDLLDKISGIFDK